MITVEIPAICERMMNYVYILRADNGEIAFIDPGEAAPYIETGLTPDIIIITHHHGDHRAGVPELLDRFDCRVLGPAKEMDKIGNITTPLHDGDHFKFGDESIHCIETPGHTMGALCYHAPESRILLSGDTLFAQGCGRLFEGTPQDMFASFARLKKLPDETRVYCGHEYTLTNAQCAADIFPQSEAITARLSDVKQLREKGEHTAPTTIGLEKKTNPFMLAENAKQFAHYRKIRDGY